MVQIVYTLLLLLMLFALYRCGKALKTDMRLLSSSGLIAILVYTLNEGLRFGRGIDYNLYGMAYEKLESADDATWDFGFQSVARIMLALDIPWQGFVIIMSMIFIIATIFFLREYKDVLPYALPLFVFFSLDGTENLVRWYLGFSFVLIGLFYLLKDDCKQNIKFWAFSVLACTFHLGLLPLPLIFYLLYLLRRPILSPIWILLLYFSIAFLFRTDFMLQFVGVVNVLSEVGGGASERMAGYSDRAEYWLTGGFAGTEGHSPFPGIQEMIFLCLLVWVGYKVVANIGKKGIFAYNMFVIGLLINPLARQIELVLRYDQTFMIFRAIVLAYIIEYVVVKNTIKLAHMTWLFLVAIILNIGRVMLFVPFYTNPEHYLYIWDSNGRTYESMYDMWIEDMFNSNSKKRSID